MVWLMKILKIYLEEQITALIKLRDKVFHVAKHPIYHGYQRGMALMTFNVFEKKSATHKGAGINFNAVSDKYCLNKRITQVNC